MAGNDIRLFVTGDLAAGRPVALTDGQVHYLARVMRLGAGDGVRLFNGRDGEWLARVLRIERRAVELSVEQQRRPQVDEAGPWLLFAPVKKSGTDFIVEKATELGASRLVPVATAHGQTPRVNRERFLAQAIEAAEQCGRLTVPEVAEMTSLARVADDWPADRALFVLDETGGGAPLAQALGDGPAPAAAFLVGPEGGFQARELDSFANMPFARRVTLGPRILRAETACLAALSLWQGVAGDWR